MDTPTGTGKCDVRMKKTPDVPLLYIVCIAFVIRIFFLCLGNWIDQNYIDLKYTDIDYHVFSDAAKLVSRNISPFERSTYRYSPILAYLLQANEIYPSFGKLIFIICDTLIIREIRSILLCKYTRFSLESYNKYHFANKACWFWCFNLISINICTRGSMDSINNYLVLLMIRLFLEHRFMISGLIYGFIIHFRVYPIIYFPLFICIQFLPFLPIRSSQKFMPRILDGLKFLFFTFIGFAIPTFYFYNIYGITFIENAYLYHLTRNDHRHNFSPQFLSIYLKKSLGKISSHTSIVTILARGVFQFLPQEIMISIISLRYGRMETLAFGTLIITFIFVTFNKVVTAQYFTWFMAILPVSFPRILSVPKYVLLSLVIVWLSSCAWWLAFAYQLEMLGKNMYLEVWIASLIFQWVNAISISLLILYSV